MEYVDAPSLAHCCALNTDDPFCNLEDLDAKRIFTNISTALLDIHSHQIVHNDIKPGNKLYSRSRLAVIIDIGLLNNCKGAKHRVVGSP